MDDLKRLAQVVAGAISDTEHHDQARFHSGWI